MADGPGNKLDLPNILSRSSTDEFAGFAEKCKEWIQKWDEAAKLKKHEETLSSQTGSSRASGLSREAISLQEEIQVVRTEVTRLFVKLPKELKVTRQLTDEMIEAYSRLTEPFDVKKAIDTYSEEASDLREQQLHAKCTDMEAQYMALDWKRKGLKNRYRESYATSKESKKAVDESEQAVAEFRDAVQSAWSVYETYSNQRSLISAIRTTEFSRLTSFRRKRTLESISEDPGDPPPTSPRRRVEQSSGAVCLPASDFIPNYFDSARGDNLEEGKDETRNEYA